LSQRIAAGESFGDVAAEVSTDAELRSVRGDLGALPRSALPPRVASRAALLRTEGQVSEPFRAEGKWNLIQLVAKPRDVPRAFDEVRPQLEQRLRAEQAALELQELLARRRAELSVSIDEERIAELDRPSQSPPGETGAPR
jgi:peptidyl-prolyl cis-trans isomerase D